MSEMSFTVEIVLDGIIDDSLYVRPLSLFREGQSDYLRELSEFTGAPLNFMKWVPVKYLLGGYWKGRQISEFEKLAAGPGYEWARGNFPASHIHEYKTEPWFGLSKSSEKESSL